MAGGLPVHPQPPFRGFPSQILTTQVHPHALQSQSGTLKSLGSRDLLVVIENLLKVLKGKLFPSRVFELEREVEGLNHQTHLGFVFSFFFFNFYFLDELFNII